MLFFLLTFFFMNTFFVLKEKSALTCPRKTSQFPQTCNKYERLMKVIGYSLMKMGLYGQTVNIKFYTFYTHSTCYDMGKTFNCSVSTARFNV